MTATMNPPVAGGSSEGRDAPVRDAAEGQLAASSQGPSSPPATAVIEYAVQLGDGTYHTDYGDFGAGEFVRTWTDIDAARDECFRVRSCGLIPRDDSLRNAQLVSREVTAWQPVAQWYDSETRR